MYNFTDDTGQFDFGDQAAAVVQEVEQTDAEVALDHGLSEAEERLEVASHYRLLLNDHMFGEMTPAASKVEKEIRRFIINRLEVLLGMKQEQAPAKDVFTEPEINALKSVAARVLK